MCYVDDPCGLIGYTGTASTTSGHYHPRLVSSWFQLAFAKGQLDKTVTWIGGTIACEPWGVKATVKEAIVSDICDDL